MAGIGGSIGLSWAPQIPNLPVSRPSSSKPQPSPQSFLYKPATDLVDGLYVPPIDPRKVNTLARKSVKDTAGEGWFEMPAPTVTPEVKKDLELIKLRNVTNPKKHFKNDSKSLPKYVQVGTVVVGPSEFYHGQLTKKERKQTLAQELLADPALKSYRKRKIQEIQDKYRPGGVDKWKNRGRQTLKRAKERREKRSHA